jgi:hypothetical protein
MDKILRAEAVAAASKPRHAHMGVKHFSAAQFLIMLAVLFIAFPFLDGLAYGALFETILLTLMMVSGVMAVGRSRSVLWIAAILVAPALAVKWLSHYRENLVPPEVFPAVSIVFVAFVVVQMLRFIFKAPRVSRDVLCAGISIYLLLGLLWTFAYVLVGELNPAAFSFNTGTNTSHIMTRFTAYYLSFMTLCTVGYGDVTPASIAARELAVMEAMTGTLYMAVLIARLVALYSTEAQSSSSSDTQSGEGKD